MCTARLLLSNCYSTTDFNKLIVFTLEAAKLMLVAGSDTTKTEPTQSLSE